MKVTRLADFAVTETLRNGAIVTIRSLRAEDRERVAAAVRGLDRESIYTRLFSYRKELTDAGLDRIMAFDSERDLMLVVTTHDKGEERVVGSGRYVGSNDGRSAEVAFVVDQAYRGLGIASRLLSHLVAFARERGLDSLEADVLAGNKSMLDVFARAGLPTRTRSEGSTVHLTLSLRA